MFYAERDGKGNIVAIRKEPNEGSDTVDVISEQELIEFLSTQENADSYVSLLTLSDRRVIRVLDDLIDVLTEKNIITLTDLPEEARQKIGSRKETREKMHGCQLTVDDII
ncbi:MAG: hypothetical protein D6B25_11345 [Desulfobulbaceae bacterium]|nr:MAG: hypothetical protein D6B25_11345 [Desulfobulbaceae bacterium]